MMERICSYSEALREGTEQEMTLDPSVIVMGIGVDDFKGIYGTTRGLIEQFGPNRVFDTPLSEDAMTGVAIGASYAGLRPIHVHIRMDFMLLAMNQLGNIASKSRYAFGGALKVPIVVRGVIGKSWGQGAQHSQGLYPLFMHFPGLRVVAPTTPYDAKGCLIASIRDDNPVIFVEHRMLHFQKGHVPEDAYTVPFGRARVLVPGADVTMVGISYMAVECMRATRCLEAVGISAEVIDPISLVPLDIDSIVESVRKTRRLLVVENDWTACGASAEIVAQVVEILGADGGVQVRRMGFEPVVCPTAKNLESAFYPSPASIAKAAHKLVTGDSEWSPDDQLLEAPVEFKGPF